MRVETLTQTFLTYKFFMREAVDKGGAEMKLSALPLIPAGPQIPQLKQVSRVKRLHTAIEVQQQ